MKHAKSLVVTAAVTLAFVAGHLMAQPDTKPKPAEEPPMTPQKVFWGDLNAAVKMNNDTKVTKLLAEAAGDPELTNVVIQKQWNYDNGEAPREMLASTFAAQQRQRQIELLEAILAELKKSNKPK